MSPAGGGSHGGRVGGRPETGTAGHLGLLSHDLSLNFIDCDGSLGIRGLFKDLRRKSERGKKTGW